MAEGIITPILQGFALGGSLIVAIGAQNAFVLRQGLQRRHLFVTAGICTLCDVVLIALGVGGLGAVFHTLPLLTALATWGGALFLLWFGLRSFRAALHPGVLQVAGSEQASTRRGTVLTVLALSLLNPHVYLDTVVLLGSVGAQYAAALRPWFAAGAALASLTWFFGLAYGAGQLAPLFARPAAWRMLDGMIGCVMWAIAASLILHQVRW